MDYILTMRDGKKERWSAKEFNAWVFANNERVGFNFDTRLSQLRRYTLQDVVDWEMEEAVEVR